MWESAALRQIWDVWFFSAANTAEEWKRGSSACGGVVLLCCHANSAAELAAEENDT